MAELNIVGISGSLRHGSLNSAALRAAQGLAPTGMRIGIASIADIPLYNDDVRAVGVPAAVTSLAAQIAAADGVLIATPEYNYSIPGVLKNTIDWLSRTQPQPFDGKPVAIMGASMGALGTGRAQYDLRKVFVFLNGMVMNRPEVMVGAAHTKFDAEGKLTDAATGEFLGKFLAAFGDWVARHKG
jgi:chromate reductase